MERIISKTENIKREWLYHPLSEAQLNKARIQAAEFAKGRVLSEVEKNNVLQGKLAVVNISKPAFTVYASNTPPRTYLVETYNTTVTKNIAWIIKGPTSVCLSLRRSRPSQG